MVRVLNARLAPGLSDKLTASCESRGAPPAKKKEKMIICWGTHLLGVDPQETYRFVFCFFFHTHAFSETSSHATKNLRKRKIRSRQMGVSRGSKVGSLQKRGLEGNPAFTSPVSRSNCRAYEWGFSEVACSFEEKAFGSGNPCVGFSMMGGGKV